jgi:hypothetical protein
VIEAVDEAASFFGVAYAMAEDGNYAVEDAYASAIGVASSYYGAIAQADDEVRLRLHVVQRAQTAYAALPVEQRRLADAFADGLNAWYHDHPEVPPRIIGRFDPWMVLAVLDDAGYVTDVERALHRAAPRVFPGAAPMMSLAFGTTRTASPGDEPLLLIASHAKRPYEARVRVRNDPAFHGFYEIGAALPHEGFSPRIAFALMDNATDVRVSVTASSALAESADSIRLNTAQGVITQRVRTGAAQVGPAAAYVNADTAIVVEETSIRPGRWQRLWDLTRAMDASSIARALADISDHAGEPGRARAIVADSTGISLVTEDSAVHVSAYAFAPGRQAAADSTIRSDGQWTLQKLIRAAFDTKVHGASAEIGALIDEWEQVGARNPERALRLDSAVSALRAWDQVSDIGSSTMTLYSYYRAQLEQNGTEHAAALRDGQAFVRFTALDAVLNDTRHPIRPWGNANAIRRGAASTPVAGAPTSAGTMFTYDAGSPLEPYVWAVSLRSGIAGSVFAFGIGYSEAAHWFDQAPLFAAGSLKTLGGPAARAAYHPGEAQH